MGGSGSEVWESLHLPPVSTGHVAGGGKSPQETCQVRGGEGVEHERHAGSFDLDGREKRKRTREMKGGARGHTGAS